MRTLVLTLLLFSSLLGFSQRPAVEKLQEAHDTLLAYQTYYAEATLKDPTNTGAKRLQLKLAAATGAVDSYLAGAADRKSLTTAVRAAHEESKRYRSDAAKRLQAHLGAVLGFANELPATYTPTTNPSATDQPTPSEEPEPAASEPATAADSPRYGATPSPTSGGNYYLFAFSLGLILLVGAYLLYQQRRLAQQLVSRLTDLEVYAGFPTEGAASNGLSAQRLEELERSLAETRSQVDVRLDKLEKHLGHLRRDHSELAENLYGTQLLKERLERLESQLGIAGTVEPTALPVAANLATLHRNTAVATAPTLTAELTAEEENEEPTIEIRPSTLPANLPYVQALAEWQVQTSLPRLAEVAHALADAFKHLKTNELPEPALLAEALQLGYVSAYNDNSLPHYQLLKTYAEENGFVIEDEMAGRMAFSEHYADNLTFETYFGLYNGHAKNLPNLAPQRDTLWQNETDASILSRTVLRVLQPAVLRVSDGAKQVVRRGTYLVKA